jgi:hypothetical protein
MEKHISFMHTSKILKYKSRGQNLKARLQHRMTQGEGLFQFDETDHEEASWDQDVVSDKADRAALIAAYEEEEDSADGQIFDEVDNVVIDEALGMPKFFDELSVNHITDHRHGKTIQALHTGYNPKTGDFLARCVSIVNASAAEVSTYLFCCSSKFFKRNRRALDQYDKVLAIHSPHSYSAYKQILSPPPFLPREFYSRLVLKRLSSVEADSVRDSSGREDGDDSGFSGESYLVASRPTSLAEVSASIKSTSPAVVSGPIFGFADGARLPESTSLVLAKGWRAAVITEIGPSQVRVELYSMIDLGGRAPKWMVNNGLAVLTSSLLPETQMYFQQIKPLAANTLKPSNGEVGDGKMIGDCLIDLVNTNKSHGKWKESMLITVATFERFMWQTRAFRELEESIPHVSQVVLQIVLNNVHADNKEYHGKLVGITANDAVSLGRSAVPIVAHTDCGEAAVTEYKENFPAIRELIELHPWFEDFLVVVCDRVASDANWTLRWRIFVGVFFSSLDVTTDIIVLISYVNAGEYHNARVIIGMMAGTLFFQIILVFMNNVNSSGKNQWLQILQVLLFIKPIVDAFDVVSGKERLEGQAFAPADVLFATKCTEVIAEAVPGAIFQTYTYMHNPLRPRAVLISIVSSVLSTAYIISYMSFDVDCSSEKKKNNPGFSGYMKDKAWERLLTCVLIFNFVAFHVLTRCFCFVLLASIPNSPIGLSHAMLYYITEGALFQAYKAVKGDWYYWIPCPPVIHVSHSFFVRVVHKALCDFTAIPHMRHPYELSGFYYMFQLVQTHVMMHVSAYVYDKYAVVVGGSSEGVSDGGETDVAAKVDGEVLVKVAIFLSLGFWFFFFSFMLSIKPELRRTFYSFDGNREFTEMLFFAHKNNRRKTPIEKDALMVNAVFGVYTGCWSDKCKKGVVEWVGERWQVWIDLQPEFFTERFCAAVPDEIIPKTSLDMLVAQGGGQRKSLSVKERVSISIAPTLKKIDDKPAKLGEPGRGPPGRRLTV